MNSVIGIALATYNGSKYIDQMLSSICKQTYTDFHVHICDDGSTDDTLEIIKASKLFMSGRVTIHSTSGGNGAMKNFRRTIEFCSEKYIALCDQDDFWVPNKLSVLLHNIKKLESEEGGGAILVFSDLEIVDSNLDVMHQSFFKSSKKNSKCTSPQDFIINNHVPGCAMMFNSESKVVFESIPDSVRMHDWWIIFIVSIYGVVFFVDTSLIKYRQHSNNTIGVPGIDNANGMLFEVKSLRHFKSYLSKSLQMKNDVVLWANSHPEFIPSAKGEVFLKRIQRGFLNRIFLFLDSVPGEAIILSFLVWCFL